METTKHMVKWVVSLSNGETFFEDKGNFLEVAGELSPWQKLLKYRADHGVSITSMYLVTPTGAVYNLPSAGKNPKFEPFRVADKPIDYVIRRYIAHEGNAIQTEKGLEVDKMEPSDWFTVGVAVYADHELQVWVDEMNPKNSWVLNVRTV